MALVNLNHFSLDKAFKSWAIFISFGILSLIYPIQSTKVYAASCSTFQLDHSGFPNSTSMCGAQTNYTVTITSSNNSFVMGKTYTLKLTRTEPATLNAPGVQLLGTSQPSSNGSITFTFDLASVDLKHSSEYFFKIYGEPSTALGNVGGCSLTSVKTPKITGDVYITQQRLVDGTTQACYGYQSGCLEASIPLEIIVENIRQCNQPYANKRIRVKLTGTGGNLNVIRDTDPDGNLPPINHTVADAGRYEFLAEKTEGVNANVAKFPLTINGAGLCGEQCLTTKPVFGSTSGPDPYKICEQIDRSQAHLIDAYNNCIECVGGSETGTDGIWTAIGCIKRDPTEIVQNLLRVGLGMGGGVALLMILAAGFLFSISQGDPKRTGEAKELITAAITGLLFIIFSVVILQFIGYTVLQIPGFGG